jgi:o-succinylbenzoate---CoA ligase
VSTALSIAAAATEAGDRAALVVGERTLSFAALAAMASAIDVEAGATPAPLVASPEPAAIAALLAHVDRGRPVALVHPRVAADEQARQAAVARAHAVPEGTLAVVFTSGSTGAPRGIVLSRASFLAAAAASAAHLGWRDDDRWLLALPLAHVGGLAVLLRCLVARRPVVVAGDDLPAALARSTLASLVPTQLDALLADPAWRPRLSLRAILLGGAAASPALLDRAAARGVPFLTTYGMTETWGQVATQPLATAGRRAPLTPLQGVTIEAGRDDAGRGEAGRGAAGRAAPAPIRVLSPTRATGVLGEPPTSGWLATSDLGWLDDRGDLHVAGRADDVIITGGENVHPLEVEAHLAAVPGVAAACVFAVADERWGQLVAAAVVPAPHIEPGALRERIVAGLTPLGAHHRPRRLAILPALPLGPTGKVDRRATASAAAAHLVGVAYS